MPLFVFAGLWKCSFNVLMVTFIFHSVGGQFLMVELNMDKMRDTASRYSDHSHCLTFEGSIFKEQFGQTNSQLI